MPDRKDTSARPAKLYTPRLLALSADLALFPLIPPYQYSAQARSRTCGSVLDVGLNLDDDACVSAIGLQVTACAIGQSSAAIMAHSIKGRASSDVPNVCLAIEAWLRGDGELPDWPDFDALAPARAHPGRHDALLLPWRGAAKALSTGTVSS